jgi:hypothetical protein
MDTKVADNKERETHVDDVDDSAFEKDIAADSERVEEFDPERSSRILRAVDIRLLPVLTMLYLISFIDRSNSMCRVLRSWCTQANPTSRKCSRGWS